MRNSQQFLLLLVVLICLLPLTGTQAGKIYKWVDESGAVHYDQQPMSDSAKEMNVYSAPPETPPQQTNNASAKKGKADNNKSKAYLEKKAANEKKYQEELTVYCDGLNKRLETMQRGGRMYVADKAGKRTFWDEDQRQAELTKTRDNIASKCSG